MNLTKEQIEKIIERGNDKNSIVEFTLEGFIQNPSKCLRGNLLELFDEIERWDLIVEYIFIHPSMMNILSKYIFDTMYINPTEYRQTPRIWNALVIVNTYVPEDMIICFYEAPMDINDGRNIALGKLNSKLIDRLNCMKAFW